MPFLLFLFFYVFWFFWDLWFLFQVGDEGGWGSAHATRLFHDVGYIFCEFSSEFRSAGPQEPVPMKTSDFLSHTCQELDTWKFCTYFFLLCFLERFRKVAEQNVNKLVCSVQHIGGVLDHCFGFAVPIIDQAYPDILFGPITLKADACIPIKTLRHILCAAQKELKLTQQQIDSFLACHL